MSDKLKLGGKVLRTIPQKTWSQTNFSNLVYLDGVMANNTEKMMLEIEPTTQRIILGNAKVQQLDSNNNVTSQTKDYRVYLQGYLDNGGTVTKPNEKPGDIPTFDEDTTVVYNYNMSPLWEAEQLMNVIDVEYSTTVTNEYVIFDWGLGSSVENIIGFSYVHDGTTTTINRLKIKSSTRLDNDIHCLVYKCDIKESNTPDYVAPSEISEFIEKGTPVNLSKYPVNNTNNSFDWVLTKSIVMNPRDVFLVLFISEKTTQWSQDIAVGIQTNYGTYVDNPKANIQYVWNDEEIYQGAITGTFYYCKPIGAKLKYNTYDY